MTAIATKSTNLPTQRVQFKVRRATTFGIQYSTLDGQVTTVNGQSSSCTCGMEHYNVMCVHRTAALAQEHRYAEQAKARAAYCVTFDIY